jgi:hypothetical protein
MSEAFFRPPELARERLTIPPGLYNQCRLALGRADSEYLFVPVREMQFQAVLGRSEVIFVDSQDYAVQDGSGGRLICLAWAFRHAAGRDSLSEPAPIELVYYREDARELHNRLVGEFGRALETCMKRQQQTGCERGPAAVLPFRR